MTELRVIQLTGNPVVQQLRPYRNSLIVKCSQLTYIDDRPVFPVDKEAALAWHRGGVEEEKATRKLWFDKDQKKMRDSVDAVIRLRERLQHQRNLSLEGSERSTVESNYEDMGICVSDNGQEKVYALTPEAKEWATNTFGRNQVNENENKFDDLCIRTDVLTLSDESCNLKDESNLAVDPSASLLLSFEEYLAVEIEDSQHEIILQPEASSASNQNWIQASCPIAEVIQTHTVERLQSHVITEAPTTSSLGAFNKFPMDVALNSPTISPIKSSASCQNLPSKSSQINSDNSKIILTPLPLTHTLSTFPICSAATDVESDVLTSSSCSLCSTSYCSHLKQRDESLFRSCHNFFNKLTSEDDEMNIVDSPLGEFLDFGEDLQTEEDPDVDDFQDNESESEESCTDFDFIGNLEGREYTDEVENNILESVNVSSQYNDLTQEFSSFRINEDRHTEDNSVGSASSDSDDAFEWCNYRQQLRHGRGQPSDDVTVYNLEENCLQFDGEETDNECQKEHENMEQTAENYDQEDLEGNCYEPLFGDIWVSNFLKDYSGISEEAEIESFFGLDEVKPQIETSTLPDQSDSSSNVSSLSEPEVVGNELQSRHCLPIQIFQNPHSNSSLLECEQAVPAAMSDVGKIFGTSKFSATEALRNSHEAFVGGFNLKVLKASEIGDAKSNPWPSGRTENILIEVIEDETEVNEEDLEINIDSTSC